MTRAQALADGRARLAGAGVPEPDQDAERLLLHAIGIPRAALWAESSIALPRDAAARYESLLLARERRTPLQLLLGYVDFHGVSIRVAPGVFIPRPETEWLVERVLAGDLPPRGSLCDIGTGTGAIAIALLHALPGWRGFAVDRSAAARALALENAERCGVAERLTVLEGDLGLPGGVPLPDPVDLVVSNPPYVPTAEIAGLMPEVRDHDPREALDGGPDGLDALRALAGGIPRWLKRGGLLAIEIGSEQADDSLGLFGPLLEGARVERDLAGLPRIMIGTMRGRDR